MQEGATGRYPGVYLSSDLNRRPFGTESGWFGTPNKTSVSFGPLNGGLSLSLSRWTSPL